MLANVIMALVADFMLVWLPAPTLSFKCAPPPPVLQPLLQLNHMEVLLALCNAIFGADALD